jgi:hypothetical protein
MPLFDTMQAAEAAKSVPTFATEISPDPRFAAPRPSAAPVAVLVGPDKIQAGTMGLFRTAGSQGDVQEWAVSPEASAVKLLRLADEKTGEHVGLYCSDVPEQVIICYVCVSIDASKPVVKFAPKLLQVTGSIAPIPGTGSISVTLTPEAANAAGARWRVDGQATQTSGASVTGLAVGSHDVAYERIDNWQAPNPDTVGVFAGQTTTLSRQYTQGPTPGPAPIPVPGFRVLIVYETADVSKYPWPQALVLSDASIRSYLNSKCVVGPDNRTKEWRIWDQNVNLTNESDLWQKAVLRSRASLPWIVISTGTTGYDGPLPKDVASTLALLKQYGG